VGLAGLEGTKLSGVRQNLLTERRRNLPALKTPSSEITSSTPRKPNSFGFRVLIRAVPPVLDWYLRFVDWTSRKYVFNEEHDGDKLRNETTIYVSFHQGLLYFIQHFRDRNGVIMASRSRDGDLVTAILHRFGYQAARGSSSRGGKEALQEMISIVKDGIVSGGLVCDAPRGPYGEPKIGIVLLAAESGRPLVPCAFWVSRKILARSWDRTLLPLPFSRIYFTFGEPIRVPAGASREHYEEIRRELGERIMALLFEMQEATGEPRQDFRPRGYAGAGTRTPEEIGDQANGP
jgi:lysophospholipid acyltransferase (LPLAT)-like uncharacterized protein